MFKTLSFVENHPNPMSYRKDYVLLDGKWDFAFDYKNQGEKKNYPEMFPLSATINVPFCYLTELSGINIKKRCDHVWYHRDIEIKSLNKKVLLHLEGADYHTTVFANAKFVGEDDGGYHRLTFDLTPYLKVGENSLVIKCDDDMSVEKPRGKQRFRKENFACWYEETTGIYKPVWLEFVNTSYISAFKITPHTEDKTVNFIVETIGKGNNLSVEISYKGEVVSKGESAVSSGFTEMNLLVSSPLHLWNVLEPELYDVKLSLKSEDGNDEVLSYLGFRSLKTENHHVYLNSKPLYQKLILDQGYFPQGDLTPKSDKDLLSDIERMIAMGFNGARKHQKREDDRFYAYSDMLGYLVWAEMPSFYWFSKKSTRRVEREWMLIVKELYNHPSIITWTPFNESWGIHGINTSKLRQSFVNRIYHETKEYDPSRFVITNDGWEHTLSDLLTIHLYEQDSSKLRELIDQAVKKGIIQSFVKFHTFAKGYKYEEQPILLTEFGGTAYSHDKGSWGYGTAVKDDNEYQERLRSLFRVVLDDEDLDGYCYTQLSDVKQEINGLYTFNREPKIDPEIMKDIQK